MYEWMIWVAIGIGIWEGIYILIMYVNGTNAYKNTTTDNNEIVQYKILTGILALAITGSCYGIYYIIMKASEELRNQVFIGLGIVIFIILFFLINIMIGKKLFNKGKIKSPNKDKFEPDKTYY